MKSSRMKYEYNFQQQQQQPSATHPLPPMSQHQGQPSQAKNDVGSFYNASTFNMETGSWNELSPAVIESSPGAFMNAEQEAQKFSRSTPTSDSKLQFPYQNMWQNDSVKMDFDAPAAKAEPAQETQAAQQQQQQLHGQPNTYNNIGNILTNLELLGNNSNFESSNFEIIPSNYEHQHQPHHPEQPKVGLPQLAAVNGEPNVPFYNVQQAAQQAYNNRHITDISNTIGPEMQRNVGNNWMHAHQSVGPSMDYKANDNNLMELSNASGNVLLPSLTNYLYHTPGASLQDDANMSINSNHNDSNNNDNNNNSNT